MINIKKEIEEMRISDEAKAFLIQTNNMTATSNQYIKNILPGVVLVGDKGAGISDFAKMYETVLRNNKVYKAKGNNRTYLELVFPRNGSEQDYEKFFNSPRIVAPTQSEFYGVFVISFREWEGGDLLKSEYFNSLMRFVDANKGKIYFVFHIKSNFSQKDIFMRKVRKYMNYVEVKLPLPDLVQATEYVSDCLDNQGIYLSQNTKEAIKDLIVEKIDFKSPAFQGYITLQRFAENIQYELLVNGEINLNETISMEVIKRIGNNIIWPMNEIDNKRGKIGFCC